MPEMAHLNSPTSHGGAKIIQGSSVSAINGLPASRVGHLVEGHFFGTEFHPANPIVTGSSVNRVDGIPAARVGDVTACGAVILPTGTNTFSS